MFAFKDFDYLTDGEIDLRISKKAEPNQEKGYVPAYIYNIVLYGKEEPIGVIDLRVGNNRNTYYGGNIGYAIDKQHRGNGYAAKACRVIKQVALAHGMQKIIITCNPDNIASRKTCDILGAVLVEIVDLPPGNEMYRLGARKKCRYEWDIYV